MSALISWVATGWILVESDVTDSFESLNIIHVRASISHTLDPPNALMLNYIFTHNLSEL
jgi:hypothetical protein